MYWQSITAVPPLVGLPAGPAVGSIVDHVAVLNALRGLQYNKEYLTAQDSGRIPNGIATQLKELLPKHGLLPFLKQYPNFFEVTLSGQVNHKNKPTYTFKVVPRIGGQGPAVGGQGPSPVGPAVGGFAVVAAENAIEVDVPAPASSCGTIPAPASFAGPLSVGMLH